jgi:hypothetical protein
MSFIKCQISFAQRGRLGDVAVFENRHSVTVAKIINESSLFILLLSFISLKETEVD